MSTLSVKLECRARWRPKGWVLKVTIEVRISAGARARFHTRSAQGPGSTQDQLRALLLGQESSTRWMLTAELLLMFPTTARDDGPGHPGGQPAGAGRRGALRAQRQAGVRHRQCVGAWPMIRVLSA